jgi:hypothetical protein
MNPLQAWSSLEIAKLIASLLTPVTVALIGFLLTKRLQVQEARDRKAIADRETEAEQLQSVRMAEEKEREDQLLRRKSPHIELSLECEFLGVSDGYRLVTFCVVARNVGPIRQQFAHAYLKVRGIRRGDAFELFKDTDRVDFRDEILEETDLVPTGKWRYVFIEPGVLQRIPFTTRMAADYAYLRGHIKVEYDEFSPHTAEAVVAVPADAD